ncbi:MAG: hypothetical protein J6Y48_03965 [Clostridia bacterium]|nr:hypothetical protein [Clostridia bacterium]
MIWEDNYLAHYGIKGQRWGLRRFQNPDGTLTPEGLKRYGSLENFNRQQGIVGTQKRRLPIGTKSETREPQKHPVGTKTLTDEQKRARTKKIVAISAGVAVAAIAGYMAYKAGHKWTGNLQKELRSQALREGTNQAVNREMLRADTNAAMMKVRSANNMMKDARKFGDNRLYARAGVYRRDAFKAAKSYNQSKIAAGKMSDYYMNMSKNATRMDAVKNYLKNHRKIVLPGYP